MSEPASHADVVVVGGGIFGSALAFHLAEHGAFRTVLVDHASPGGGASARSGGVLTYPGWGAWDLRLVRESAEEYRALSELLGRGRYRENGGLRVARTSQGEAWISSAQAEMERVGLPARLLSPSETQAALPTADLGDVRGALLSPNDALCDAGALSNGYVRLAEERDTEFRWNTSVSSVQEENGTWAIELGEGAPLLRTPHLVLCCGAGTKGWLRRLGHELPLAPFRAQVGRWRPSPLVGEFPTLHDLDLDLYVRPDRWGRVRAGDGTERREVDPDVVGPEAEPAFLERTSQLLRELFPAWSSLSLEEGWSGVCVASPDPYPLVGGVPGAPGLYVASGFNGFGAMRAAGLARRLAQGVLTGRWDALAPADPARFPPGAMSFVPAPELPLRDDLSWAPSPAGIAPAPEVGSVPPALSFASGVDYRVLGSPEEVDGGRWEDLSDWFQPFLPLFAKEALRVGGEVQLAHLRGEVVGLYLFAPTETSASIFTRVRSVGEHFLGLRTRCEVYSEHPWVAGGGPIQVMMADLRDWSPHHRLRNPIRVGERSDLPGIQRLLREVSGPVDEAWFADLPRPDEVAFVCEIDGRIAGVSWLTLAGDHGRGHSFVVHARYRGLGIGTDMLIARMLYLRERGARQVVSEIYDGNEASIAAAQRAGMSRVGTMYSYRRP